MSNGYVYEADVHEALIFAPPIEPYNGHNINHMVFVVPNRKVVPHIRRILNQRYGAPSRSEAMFSRYDNLIFHFVGDPNGNDKFNKEGWYNVYSPHIPAFYVCELGQRVGITPGSVHNLITDKWIPLVLSVMPESDAWLHIKDNVTPSSKRLHWSVSK